MRTIGDLLSDIIQLNDKCELSMAEDKVKVDRHKLADMLQDRKGINRAQSFFEKVMRDTGTEVTWPKQLKTSAKSKRDAYVKIYGNASSIAAAKAKILEVLTIESKSLVLKLDVSYDHHSYMIGKDGHNIQQIMNTTGCHIHFPDSNRNNQAEKSNQVSISGNPDKAQEARRLVRESMPIVVKFEIPVTRCLPDSATVISHFEQTYDITIRPTNIYIGSFVEVRGSRKHVDCLSQGINAVKEYLFGMRNVRMFLTMQISNMHHSYVRGRGDSNINQIMLQTDAAIIFPEPSVGVNDTHKMAVGILGTFDSVYKAWEKLLDHLPFVMIFDLKDGHEIHPVNIHKVIGGLDITINIRTKSKQNQSKVAVLKSPEMHAEMLFYLRKLLLHEKITEHEDSLFFSPPQYHSSTDICLPAAADPETPHCAISPLHVINTMFDPRILVDSNLQGSTCASTISSPSISPRSDYITDSILKPCTTVDPYLKYKETNQYLKWYQSSNDFPNPVDRNISAPITHRSANQTFQTEHSSYFPSTGNGFKEDASHLSRSSRIHAHPTESLWRERRCCTSFDDYEMKKHLATKAMKSPVGSEMRVPTDVWAGYGFSKSMPPSVIKNKLLETSPWAVSQPPLKVDKVHKTTIDTEHSHDPCFHLGRYSFAGNNFLSSSNCFDAISLPSSVNDSSDFGDLPTVLRKMGLGEHLQVFQKHEIDVPILLAMNESDLEEVGIECCHQQKILQKIAEFKQRENNRRRLSFEAAPGAERSLSARLQRLTLLPQLQVISKRS